MQSINMPVTYFFHKFISVDYLTTEGDFSYIEKRKLFMYMYEIDKFKWFSHERGNR